MPKLVEQYTAGTLPIDHYITHTFQGVDKVSPAAVGRVWLRTCMMGGLDRSPLGAHTVGPVSYPDHVLCGLAGERRDPRPARRQLPPRRRQLLLSDRIAPWSTLCLSRREAKKAVVSADSLGKSQVARLSAVSTVVAF